MQQQLTGDFETSPEAYALLRSGLSAYSQHFLPAVMEWLQDMGGGRILDFCGGAGQYLVHLLEHNKQSTGVLLDKEPGLDQAALPPALSSRLAVIEGDVKLGHPIFEACRGEFDLVIMSEILHCMTNAERDQAIGNCFTST